MSVIFTSDLVAKYFGQKVVRFEVGFLEVGVVPSMMALLWFWMQKKLWDWERLLDQGG